MSEMDAFMIREQANEGRLLPLAVPDGTATDHWLQIRSQWSDAFRSAREQALREAARLAQGPAGERQEALEEGVLAVRAALVADWSFAEPCTPENVRAFLRAAPQIADQVDRAAVDDAAFFGSAFASSPTG